MTRRASCAIVEEGWGQGGLGQATDAPLLNPSRAPESHSLELHRCEQRHLEAGATVQRAKAGFGSAGSLNAGAGQIRIRASDSSNFRTNSFSSTAWMAARQSGYILGRVSWTQVPFPGALWTSMRPPR